MVAATMVVGEEIQADEVVLGMQLSLLLEPMIAALPAKLRDPLTQKTPYKRRLCGLCGTLKTWEKSRISRHGWRASRGGSR